MRLHSTKVTDMLAKTNKTTKSYAKKIEEDDGNT